MRFLVLLIFFTSCIHSKKTVDDAIKNMAEAEFFEFEELFYESVGSNKIPKRSEVERNTVYKGVLKSPLKKTEFYRFAYTVFEPNLEVVIYQNEELKLLNDYYEAERDVLFSHAFITKLNSLIALEESPEKLELVSLFGFMLEVYYGDDQPLRLRTWNEIPYDEDYPIADSLKGRIHEFKKVEKESTVRYSGFIWEPSTRYLYEVDIQFFMNTGSLEIKSINLGEVGVGIIKA